MLTSAQRGGCECQGGAAAVVSAQDGAIQGSGCRRLFHSWKSGLALCALIHRHRPDLLNYDSLPKSDPHACTRLAFDVAQQHLGIPQLLDVEDLCDAKKPDDRSVMTYVAQYFHAFSSMEQAEVVSRRVATFADVMQGAWMMQQDYERRAKEVEALRSRRINAEIRNAKEMLRVRFADLANEFERRIREVTNSIARLVGELEDQLDNVKRLQTELGPLKSEFLLQLEETDRDCREANVEENDHTIFTLDGLGL
ncbi:hypothetical protein L7F22_029876 [Adiantum nelumboides]|nr:hypothetical protein [Adiantum nelumboides]